MGVAEKFKVVESYMNRGQPNSHLWELIDK